MQITHNKHSKKSKTILYAILTAVIIVSLYTLFAWYSHLWPFATRTTAGIDPTAPNTHTNSPTTQSTSPLQKTPTQYDNPSGSDPSQSSALTGIVNFSGTSGDGKTLQIRATIDQKVTDGTCNLTLSKSGSTTVTKTANIVSDPSSSTCSGFDIPIDQLSSGIWSININLTSDSRSGSIQGVVTVQ